MENQTENPKYLSERIGLREVLQIFANVAIIYMAYAMWEQREALEHLATVIKR